MKKEYIPKVVPLLAGAVVCIVTIVRHMDVTYSLAVLLATLIIFYIVGLIAMKIIEKVQNSNRVMQEKRDKMLEEAQEEEKKEEAEKGMEAPGGMS